ncbi:MAG: hypothetical protein ACLULH_13250 [Bacteroides fragilis]
MKIPPLRQAVFWFSYQNIISRWKARRFASAPVVSFFFARTSSASRNALPMLSAILL